MTDIHSWNNIEQTFLLSHDLVLTKPPLQPCEENRELAAATLRSIALNYIKRKGPTPPKSMLRAIGQLK